MILETKKENLCINQIVGQSENTINVEGDIIIPDIKPDILNAINTSGNVCIYKKDIMDGKIKIDGGVNVYVMYMPDGESQNIRSLNTNIDFTAVLELDEARIGMTSSEEINIKNIECKVLNGRKINLKIYLQVKIKVCSNEDVNLIKEINNSQDIQILSKQETINSLVGEGSNKVCAKDKLTIDEIDNLAEILKANFNIINKEIKISYNKVLAKADLDIKLVYLTEDNRINKVQAQIPIMGFVDIPNVNENNICDVRYNMKNIIIKPNSQDEHGIYVEAQIELNCSVFETKQINVIQDLYSTKDILNYSQKLINTITEKKSYKDICKIEEKIQVQDIENNKIYDVDVKPIIVSQSILNDKIIYEGELEIKFLYEAENITKIDSKIMKLNFNFTMDANGINSKNKVNTVIAVKQADFVTQGNGNIECKIQLEIEANIYNTKQINIIDEIKTEAELPTPNYSMIIYFVKNGDCVWNIAKKFNSTVADIIKINQIEDENKLKSGMQLFIPKYIYKKLA